MIRVIKEANENPDWVISTDHATGIKIFNEIKEVLKKNNIKIKKSFYTKNIIGLEDFEDVNGSIFLDDSYETDIFIGSYVCVDFGYNVQIASHYGDNNLPDEVISSIKSIVSKYPGWEFDLNY